MAALMRCLPLERAPCHGPVDGRAPAGETRQRPALEGSTHASSARRESTRLWRRRPSNARMRCHEGREARQDVYVPPNWVYWPDGRVTLEAPGFVPDLEVIQQAAVEQEEPEPPRRQNGHEPADESTSSNGGAEAERCFLVGVELKGRKHNDVGYTVHESLDELGRLARTAGLEVVGSTYQAVETPSPRTFIGAGKLAEVTTAVEACGADTVVFDDELTPGQLRNLERHLADGAVRVCDRTALILDIFAQRAATREGFLQVELAAAEYQLPRLTRMWSHLERQAGGAKTRGMGEKQIEIDKRLLRERMARLRRDLTEVRRHRRNHRERRAQVPLPVIALVGYTNAGKSSLLNRLTDAGVIAEDKLFATLDPTTRRLRLPSGKEVLFTDTVGFIQKLPTQLVAAFRATLEEVADAALLVHVVDVSQPNAAAQSAAVLKVLGELDIAGIPMLTCWNKLDACADPAGVCAVAAARPGTACVSAATGEGVPQFLALVEAAVADLLRPAHALLPFAQGELLERVHSIGVVDVEAHLPDGTLVAAAVPPGLHARLAPYALTPADFDRLLAAVPNLELTPRVENGLAGQLQA